MTAIDYDTAAPATPRISAATLLAVLAAGSIATVAFDLFGQALSPLAGYAKLAPVGLAKGTIKTLFGTVPSGAGDLLHYLVGLIGYPLGWLLVARPLADRIVPAMPKMLVAAAMAHLVVGMPAFLGFTGITWVALVGHVLFAVVFVAAYEALRGSGKANHV